MELALDAEQGVELTLNAKQGVEAALNAEQGVEGIDEMESSKSSPARRGRKEERRRDRVQFYETLGASFPLYVCLTRLLLLRSAKSSGDRSHEAPIPARVLGPPLVESCSVLASALPHALMCACMPALCRLGAAPALLLLIPMGEAQVERFAPTCVEASAELRLIFRCPEC
jgi:hypothetical protein